MLEYTDEAPGYLTEQIITYIGNKRALLSFIGEAVKAVQKELCKERLSLFDVFSGSGIVSRFFKKYASALYVNDLEAYSQVSNSCYLSNRSEVDERELTDMLANLRRKVEDNLHGGFITEL